MPLPEAYEFNGTVPKTELWVETQGQIDFHDDPALVDPALIDPAADAIARSFTDAVGAGGSDL